MSIYREKSEWLMRDNPALKKIRFHARLRFFIRLVVIEVAMIGLTASMIGLTEAAIPLGILMAIFLPILILKPSRVFTTHYGRIKAAEVHTAFVRDCVGCGKDAVSVSSFLK